MHDSAEKSSVVDVTKIPGFQEAARKQREKLREKAKTCTHENWRHGRSCPDCGTMLVDFGD